MDSEEYYDSLDEDSNYGSIGSSEETFTEVQPNNIKISSKIPVKINRRCCCTRNELNVQEEDDVIPFYGQSLSRSEVDVKTLFSKDGCNQDKFKRNSKNHPRKKKSCAPVMNRRLKSNSYLDMFYAKTGLDGIHLSTRATCTDLSPKSYVTSDDFDGVSVANFSETESMYSSGDAKNDLSLSVSSLDSKVYSASQINDFSFSVLKPKTRYTGKSVTQVPELGSLGPDIPKDKLELFKRRLDYGHKASQKNKIKMMERKLLSNLQKEIKQCKDVV